MPPSPIVAMIISVYIGPGSTDTSRRPQPTVPPPTPPPFPSKSPAFSAGSRPVPGSRYHNTAWQSCLQPAFQLELDTPTRPPVNSVHYQGVLTPNVELCGESNEPDDLDIEPTRTSSPVPFDDEDEDFCPYEDDRLPPSLPIYDLDEPPNLLNETSGRLHDDFGLDELLSSSGHPSLPVSYTIPRQRSIKVRPREKNERVLDEMRKCRVHPLQLLCDILDPDVEYYERWWKQMLREDTKQVDRLLETLWKHKEGQAKLKEWFEPQAPEMVSGMVTKELESTSNLYQFSTKKVTPEFLATWLPYECDEHGNPRPYGHRDMPTWVEVLNAAIPPKNNSRDWELSQCMVTNVIQHARSLQSCRVPIVMGLHAWTDNASRQTIELMSRCGMSMSMPSLFRVVHDLADRATEEAIEVWEDEEEGAGLNYDNINIKSSEHVEQTGNQVNKVRSGTFPMVVKLYGARKENMLLEPMLLAFREASDLTIADIRPSIDSLTSYQHQCLIHAIKILSAYETCFGYLASHPLLQYLQRRPLPSNLISLFYPLRVSIEEEASIAGNLRVHEDVFITQLKQTPDNMNRYAIPSFNDQLTNARIRGCKSKRAGDLTAWHRRDVFQLGLALFHLIMNLIWALLNHHRGSIHNLGSLSYFFALLDKKRLGNEKPDYHTLLVSLTQILHGYILNEWRRRCGHCSLADFAAARPSMHMVKRIATDIVLSVSKPSVLSSSALLDAVKTSRKPKNNDKTIDTEPDTGAGGNGPTTDIDPDSFELHQESVTPTDQQDPSYDNLRLLIRDLFYVRELVEAVSSGDFGRVEDILPDVAAIFKAAGSNNYCMEIMHFLYNVKKVWTPEFANIMRDNHLCNLKGHPNTFMATDMRLEHIIGYIKALFISKGVYSGWDQLGNISAAILHLQSVKKQVRQAFNTSYQGSTHSDVETAHLVWRVANNIRDARLDIFGSVDGMQ
ncbi:hypothetical protein AAF712_010738 [Marasmius tenuissimus]|uniref:DUF6589 domain-containing protein n=1 Tax=Marasmius tenuissimus TaxID=585030 RepID=A0ABR2ZMJ4_9AGAR